MVKGTLTLEPSQVLKIDDTGRIQRIVTPSSGRVYTTDTDGRYVEIYTTDTTHLRNEATYTNEEIYPSHVSKVSTVEKVRDHFEVNSDLDLDYNKQRIEGEQMQIVFQSGNLAGREFDAVYKTSTKRFAITPKEEDETTLPNDILCPKVGDRYIITGIELPQQYIDEAQEKLTDAAVQQLEEMQNTRYSYKAEVDPVYLYNNRTAIADKLTVGKYVHLTDTQIAQGDPYIRITSKRTYLDRIYQPEIELSNEVEEYSFFERLKDSIGKIARIDRKGELARINRQIDVTMPDRIKDKIKGDTELQGLLKGEPGHNPKPSDVADLIANSKTYRDQITYGLPDENRVKELARELDNERKVGGRNLFREKYFAGDLASCFRIPFEAVTPRAEYNTYTLSFDYKISADDKASSPRVSITYKTQTFVWDTKVIRDGAWHHKVITFNLEKMDESEYPLTGWLTDYSSSNGRTIDMVAVRNIKLERGNVATDWTPAPEDIQSEIKDLKKNELTPIEKEWVGKMGSIFFPNMEDSPQNKGGLSIDRSMFLRFSDGKPSALIGGQIGDRSGGNAILMAGVNGYGTDNLSARTAIYQDGTARFGDVNLSDKTISLMPKSGLPLRVTAEDGTFIENFLANSKVDKNIAYEHSFVLVGKGEARTYSFDVANNDTKLTITIPTLTSEVYQINQSVTLTLDGVTLGSWRGDTKLIREDTSGFEGGGVRFRKENTPLVVENLKFERYLNSGSHTLSVSVTSTDTKDKATISKLTAHLYYDASQAETNLTRYGFRAFGGQSRYFDIDWRWTYRYKGYMTTSNPYIARVKGGMRVDSLTLEQPLDAPGCVLAGGEVDSNGQVTKSFGRYKKKQGDNTPSTKFDYNTHYYTVYHSINNTNYIPIVTSRSSAWADVPRVMSVSSNSFTIAFINETNKVSDWRQPFIYTCYKAD